MRIRDVFIFWLPLLVSWMLMTSEGPVITSLVSRRPDAVVQLAAVGIVIALSVAIESPIIQLLATATALVEDRSSFETVRRFTWHWMWALTAVHLLIGWTDVFELVVGQGLAPPPEVASAVKTGMRIMVPWSAAIAWRRFLQGVLIRFGHPRTIAWGTAFRLLASGGTALFLAFGTDQSGVAIGSWALVNGVLVEALYASLAARALLRADLRKRSRATVLSYRALWRFHFPLAMTSMLALMVQPLITATLARLDAPEISLAAWPVVFYLTLWTRAPAFALPEAVVALSSRPNSESPIRKFSLILAAASLVGMAGFLSPLASRFYLETFQGLQEEVLAASLRGIFMLLPFPALAILISWVRGRLIVQGRTGIVNFGMVIHVAASALILGLALWISGDGLVWAAFSMTAASAIEVAVLLYLRGKRSAKRPS